MKHILETDSIQLAFNGRKILSDIYLKCETGTITGLLGQNGQGKSCLMQIIFGSLNCEKSVRIDNSSQKNIFGFHNMLLYLPQFNFIPKSLSLQRIFLDFGLEYSLFQIRFPEFKNRHREKIKQLSGGEQRLIALYVIVKSKTFFAILDEPFTHLNPIQIEKVKGLLVEGKVNKGILITDHMYKNVTDISDSLYILSNGKTHLSKSPEDIETLGYARIHINGSPSIL
jgi:ABC-type multidrug transport system ATPase subunit